ncbi:hypothetical protein AQUCO_04400047v1 [Aquilegia coerulea]|uniref:NOG1 N-terminal helical domain-containing protein n=1 Tax=Aquilegia coerulea TaxID=218851 RepID=A0A2G5CMU7_AQUCA|nr:hypothetical protein AQUCO_04400047v1 [Aquilegia coerulea]
MKELGIPLREYMENFLNKKYLHPYERSLIELTLGDGNYEEVLGRLNALKKKVVSVGKEHASLCAKSTTKREAEERLREGMKLEAKYKQEAKAVDDLLNIAKTLRAVPVVDLETPTLCLVGASNYIIYKEVGERFSNHLWVDVVSKCDLLPKSPVQNITGDGDEDTPEMARYRKAGPEGAILVSVMTETGLDELKSRVHDMLISQLEKLKSESASPES